MTNDDEDLYIKAGIKALEARYDRTSRSSGGLGNLRR